MKSKMMKLFGSLFEPVLKLLGVEGEEEGKAKRHSKRRHQKPKHTSIQKSRQSQESRPLPLGKSERRLPYPSPHTSHKQAKKAQRSARKRIPRHPHQRGKTRGRE